MIVGEGVSTRSASGEDRGRRGRRVGGIGRGRWVPERAGRRWPARDGARVISASRWSSTAPAPWCGSASFQDRDPGALRDTRCRATHHNADHGSCGEVSVTAAPVSAGLSRRWLRPRRRYALTLSKPTAARGCPGPRRSRSSTAHRAPQARPQAPPPARPPARPPRGPRHPRHAGRRAGAPRPALRPGHAMRRRRDGHRDHHRAGVRPACRVEPLLVRPACRVEPLLLRRDAI